jgi:hypothetical protein
VACIRKPYGSAYGTSRDKIADELGVSSSQIGKLLFIQKVQPDYIDMIDEQRLTIRQAYLTVTRTKKQRESHIKAVMICG